MTEHDKYGLGRRSLRAGAESLAWITVLVKRLHARGVLSDGDLQILLEDVEIEITKMIDMIRAFKAAECSVVGTLDDDELDDFARYYKYLDFADMATAAQRYVKESLLIDGNHPGIKNLGEFMEKAVKAAGKEGA